MLPRACLSRLTNRPELDESVFSGLSMSVILSLLNRSSIMLISCAPRVRTCGTAVERRGESSLDLSLGWVCSLFYSSSEAEYPFRHHLLIGFVCLRHDRHRRSSHLGRRAESDRVRTCSIFCPYLPRVNTLRAEQCRGVFVSFRGRAG